NVIFVAPAALVLFAILLYPVAFTLYFSVHEWFVSGRTSPEFIGLQNFIKLLEDSRFVNSVLHSLYFVLLAVGSQTVLGVALALLLHREFFGRGIVRTLLLLPMMSTPAAIALVWLMMMDPNLGILNY